MVVRICLLPITRGRSTGSFGFLLFLASWPSLGVRVDSAGFAHRLWQPGGGLQDPVWSHDVRCPQELATQYPAWERPVQVRPAVYGGGWEWIPGSVDPTLVSVVVVAPPMPAPALLPRVCTARILLHSLQLQTPSLTDVVATPAAWRGTRKQAVPTLYLRNGGRAPVPQPRLDSHVACPPCHHTLLTCAGGQRCLLGAPLSHP